MALPSVIQGDVQYTGNVSAASFTLPNGGIFDQQIANAAAIAATKVCHRFPLRIHQNGTAASGTYAMHAAFAAGTLQRVAISAITAAVGAATVTLDVKKNGTTILASTLTLDSTTSARTQKLGTLATGQAYVAGDYFEAVITATAGGGTLPTGLLVEVFVDENPS